MNYGYRNRGKYACARNFSMTSNKNKNYSVPEPTPSTMTALHLFGAEMLKLSRGLDSVSPKFERKDISLPPPSLNNKNITTIESCSNTPAKELVKTCQKDFEKSKGVKATGCNSKWLYHE